MKTLYYLSYALTFPFYAVAGILFGIGWCFSWIADSIHDATTYKIWLKMHNESCRLKRVRENELQSVKLDNLDG